VRAYFIPNKAIYYIITSKDPEQTTTLGLEKFQSHLKQKRMEVALYIFSLSSNLQCMKIKAS
jgi:hypothetical protein